MADLATLLYQILENQIAIMTVMRFQLAQTHSGSDDIVALGIQRLTRGIMYSEERLRG